jgi:2-isopropylmalate synthase
VWGTVGVSENIIEASWLALVDAIEYKLAKDEWQPEDNQERALSAAAAGK